MTNDYTDKARALFLAALMVFSVFAGTVAFAGSAAAAATGVSATDADLNNGGSTDISVDHDSTASATAAYVIDVDGDGTYNSSTDIYASAAADNTTTTDFNGVDVSSLSEGDYNVYAAHGNTSEADEPTADSDVTESGWAETTGTLTVTDSTSDEYDADRFMTISELDGSVLWGESVAVEDFTGNDSVTLRSVDGDDTTTVESLNVDDNGVIEFDSSELDSGNYELQGNNQDGTVSFEVADQTWSAEFAADEVQSDDQVDVEFDSSRASYDIIVSADGLDAEDLAALFEQETGFDDVSTEDEDSVRLAGVTDGTYEADFNNTDIDTGEYEFTFESADTSAEATDTINVTEAGEGDATIVNSTVEQQQGDIAEFTIELDEVTTGTVVIGDLENDNYQLNFTVDDGDGDSDDADGEVTVRYNTYLAGQDSDNVVTAVSDDDSVNVTGEESLNGNLLDDGDYDIRVSPTEANSDADVDDAMDDETDLATLVLDERSTDEMNLWRASEDNADDLLNEDDEQASALSSALENDLVTETDFVAGDEDGNADTLIMQVSASGLEGLLSGTDGSVSTSDFRSALGDDNSLGLSIVQTEGTVGNNADAKEVNVSQSTSAFSLIADGENDEYYIVFNPEDSNVEFEDTDDEFEAGDEFTATLDVQDAKLLDVDEGDGNSIAADSDDFESVNSSFAYEEATGSFEDPTNVTASEEAEVTGETNIAPGSEISIRIQSTDDTEPRFIETASDNVVNADGTFSGTFDLSDNAAGDTFEVSARNTFADIDAADGNIVESVGTSTPGTDDGTPTTDDGTPTTDDGTPTETATPTEGDGNGGDDTPTETTTPGFTAVLALIALIGAALVAVRRD
ncbi:BGTF surface domain-containing protein [Halorarum salinum]|uniref:PGF-CTERM sorting domain-containing protein n=1 Tax=Halorarum salinum TaxID=2743089 RepID=A0A7D5L8B7_9EURY|nr:BGTF surface domain-containing protein [Halobaculum salinum]QLG60513.1 PGF-CTERM sorting domain-containing protein [Halobaculum salinum]